MSDFDDRVVIVTGAGSGIGRTTAEMFAERGARVVVSDIDEEGGAGTVDSIESADGEAIFVRTDVSDPDDCRALVERTVDRFGSLDIACNNAGIGGAQAPIGEYEIDDWRRVIDINLSGQFFCMRYEIPAMLANGGGAIVNVSSILGQVGFATSPGYVAAKHGLLGLTKNAALEYSGSGIRVNAVGPAFISTPMISDLEEDQETHDMLVSRHPIGRLGRTEEVAELILFLASERASFITGSYHPVDGGYLAS